MLKFEKYQRVILGPSSSHSLASLEKKFGKTFPGFVWVILKKPAKKWNFDQNSINFTEILVILTKKQVFCI